MDIEDGEIPGIQEGLERLLSLIEGNDCIFLCADNQNGLRALAGGRVVVEIILGNAWKC